MHFDKKPIKEFYLLDKRNRYKVKVTFLKNYKILITVLSGSIIFILYFTLFSHPSLGIGDKTGGINISPIITIDLNNIKGNIMNIIGNIILFVPFGTCLGYLYKKQHRILKVLLTGFLSSLIIEIFQLCLPNRWTDINDIILNTLGSIFGYLLFLLLNRVWSIKE